MWSSIHTNGFDVATSTAKCTSADCRERSNAKRLASADELKRRGSALADGSCGKNGCGSKDDDGSSDYGDVSSHMAQNSNADSFGPENENEQSSSIAPTMSTLSPTSTPADTASSGKAQDKTVQTTRTPSTTNDSSSSFFSNLSLMLCVLIIVAGCYAARRWRARRSGRGSRFQPDLLAHKAKGHSVSAQREEYVKTVQTDYTEGIPGVPSTTHDNPSTSFAMHGSSTPKPFAKPFETEERHDNGENEEEMVTTFPAKYSVEALRRKQLTHAEGERRTVSHHPIAAVKVASLQMPPTTPAGGRMKLKATPATFDMPPTTSTTTAVHVGSGDIHVAGGGEGGVEEAAHPGNISPPLDAGNDEEWGW